MAQCLARSQTFSQLSDIEMNVILWRKLAVKCVINPLMAIHNVRNSPLHDVMTGQGESAIVAIDHDKLLNCWNNELFLDNISA